MKILSYRIDTPRGSIDLFSDNKEHCLALWKKYYVRMEGAKFVEITTTREEKVLEEYK